MKGKVIKVSRLSARISKQIGRAPGEVVSIGKDRTGAVKITIIDYDEAQVSEKVAESAEECFPYKETPTVTWINIDGVHDTSLIEIIGKHFGLHPLVLEDIANTGQRPKVEDYGEYLFIVLKMLYLEADSDRISVEQVSLILGTNFVISFQEREGDVFNPVRDRIRTGKGRVRKMGADYLAYALVDAVVDNYFIVLEHFGDSIEGLEDELVTDPTPDKLQTIHGLKRELILLRRSVWPLRELISGLERSETELVTEGIGIYLRDVYDHTIQVIDTVESYRDMVSGMLDIYMSSVSNRMNEVMKVLTIIATIFIPITFIAGIYGMNFEFMPELKWRYAYFVALGIMGGVTVAMLMYFRRKKWF
jgi:magnesium transporter